MSTPVKATIDAGEEWVCTDCPELRHGHYSSWYATEPPEARCIAEGCPVDVPALRELEAQIELAASYLAGVLTIHCHGWYHVDLFNVLSEAIAEAFTEEYSGARVAYTSIQLAVVQKAQEQRAKAVA
jgi:hypothetical protein